VAGASREQTQGITQINAAVGQMDKVTQSNAANAEESAAAAQELNAQAEVMKQAVAELRQLVGGQIGATTATNPAKAKPRVVSPPAAQAVPLVAPRANGHARLPQASFGAEALRTATPPESDFRNF